MALNPPPPEPAAPALFVENVLNGFNGRVDLRVVYTWDQVRVCFFGPCRTERYLYGMEGPEVSRELFYNTRVVYGSQDHRP